MHITVVGRGQLATEILDGLQAEPGIVASAWPSGGPGVDADVIAHAGSGRELPEVVAHCRRTGTPLLELSTGSALEQMGVDFPAVLCPNTNLLMLKLMRLLAAGGASFARYPMQLIESHQATKTSAPGTALALAASLGLPAEAVVSVRDPAVQREALGIPPEHLGRHAVHRLLIDDGACSVAIETRVFGAAPYVQGVRQIAQAVRQHALEPRLYPVDELLERGWL